VTDLAIRNRRSAMFAGLVALFMVGLGFAAVPLYQLFCQVTGFAGTTGRATDADLPWKPAAGTVLVRFDANVNPGLPWRFRPEKNVEQVRVGERLMAFYIAENLTDRPVTGRATYNVSPDQAGGHFKKIDCFCFTEQTLKPRERVRMPIIYFVDPAMLKDVDAKDVQQITLSYTFYPVEASAKAR
jgi:cytochrome c oxidase assembly protein subunit 11